MSWLARSIANSLLIDDEHQTPPTTTASPPPQPPSNPHIHQNNDDDNEERENGDLRGVKEDITEFRETLTRQLWGVANFLAPPAPPPPPPARRITNERVVSELNRRESPDPSVSGGDDDGDEDDDSSSVYARISTAHSDNSDIGGSFQGGFINRRMFDNRGGVRESIYEGYGDRFGLQNVEDHDDDHEGEDEGDDWINDAVGLTDEVLTFAGNIGHHPETWLDFPVEDEEDLDDFPMSEAQKKHAQAVEHLTPRLAALRIELCPTHMSIGFFWKVYFVLLHSRLNKQDAELLSTPEVVEARAKWMQELQKRAKKESERYHGGLYSKQSADLDEDFTPRSLHNEHAETLSSWTFASEPATSSTTADSDTEKQFVSNDMQFTNKSIVDEKPLTGTDDRNFHAAPMSKRLVLNFDDDDDDDWPEDDCLGQNATVYPVGIEEEVSFSDLEDDDCCLPVKSKPELRV